MRGYGKNCGNIAILVFFIREQQFKLNICQTISVTNDKKQIGKSNYIKTFFGSTKTFLADFSFYFGLFILTLRMNCFFSFREIQGVKRSMGNSMVSKCYCFY